MVHRTRAQLVCAIVLVFATVASALTAGDGIARAEAVGCIRDDRSREVCLRSPARRVVSLAPNLTELLFGIGAGLTVVGRTSRCNLPAEASLVPEVGSYGKPHFERILSLRPDLVVSARGSAPPDLLDRLGTVGIPVFQSDTRNLDDILQLIADLGRLTGCTAESNRLRESLLATRDATRASLSESYRPTVVLAVGLRPLVVAGGRSFIGALIREAGGINIAEDLATPYPRISTEEIVRKDPEYIVILNKECPNKEACREFWEPMNSLRAVRNGNIHILDADLLARPSDATFTALTVLVSLLHPRNARPMPSDRPGGVSPSARIDSPESRGDDLRPPDKGARQPRFP